MNPESPNSPQPIGPSDAPRRPSRLRRLVVIGLLTPLLLAAFLVLAHRPLLVGFAHLFRVDNPAPSDVIVMLLGGTPHRAEKAAQLYKIGIAPKIILCRERPDPVFQQDASDLIKDYLVRLGVPSQAIEILPVEVTSTKDEAERVSAYLGQHPARRITVVTTAFHTARAGWIFRRILKNDSVDVRTAAAKDPGFDESNWYRTEDGLIFYFNELIKTIYYRLSY